MSDMVRNELQSQLYAYLGGATATASGHEWDHDRLRVFVDSLMALPAIQALMAAREATFRERYDLLRTLEAVRTLADEMEAEVRGGHDEDDDAYRDAVDRIRRVLGGESA